MLGQMVHRPLRKDQRQQIEPSLINSCGQGSLDALYGVLAEQGNLDELYGDLAELTNRIHSCGALLRPRTIRTAQRLLGQRREVAFRPLLECGAEGPPSPHQSPAFVEQVATPVGRFHLAADDMRQCHLDNLTRKIGTLGCPIAEARPKSMDRNVRV